MTGRRDFRPHERAGGPYNTQPDLCLFWRLAGLGEEHARPSRSKDELARGESKETLRYTACLLSLSSSACWLLTSDFYSSPSSLRFTAPPNRGRRLPEHSHLAGSRGNPPDRA